MNPHAVTAMFEDALCDYTGAPYAVATTSCTMALLLALRYERVHRMEFSVEPIICPTHTYVGVPQSIIHAGFRPDFYDRTWQDWGHYQLTPTRVVDSARLLTGGMYEAGLVCISFHWTKHLAIGHGGAILTDNHHAADWLRRARFDGRGEGTDIGEDPPPMLGYHAYMSPRDAAEGLSRLAVLPKHNDPLPYCDYPDLSKMEVFR